MKHSSNLEAMAPRSAKQARKHDADSHLESALLIVICKLGAQIVVLRKRRRDLRVQKINFVRGSALLAYVGLRMAHLGARLANIGACWRQDGVKMEQ